jgi:beta-N-acetylhexosaminidase
MKDIRRLTLEEKVGQLFFLGFNGFEPDAETLARVEKIRPGGFLISQRNIESFDQLHALSARFREPHGIPALLAIEHEGGRVDRLKQIFGPVPSLAEMATLGTSYLRAGARLVASELEAVGLNMDLAPVVDLQTPGAIVSARCFSHNPLEVARLASACIEEFSKRNVVTAIKHFPGLGAARSDPHFTLPRIEKSKKQLLQEDILPFLNLVDEAPAITVCHAHYPGLGDDKPCPASLSPRVVEGFLRNKLGFQGVVITDDLTMGAISSLGLNPEVFLRAFEAGNDMVLFSQTTPLVEDAFRLVVRSARANAALRARIEASLERVMILKSRIQYVPPRYRAHLRSRISRQIEKLRSEVSV